MTVKVQDLCSQKTKGNRQCSSKWTKRSLATVVKVVTARTAGKEGKKRDGSYCLVFFGCGEFSRTWRE